MWWNTWLLSQAISIQQAAAQEVSGQWKRRHSQCAWWKMDIVTQNTNWKITNLTFNWVLFMFSSWNCRRQVWCFSFILLLFYIYSQYFQVCLNAVLPSQSSFSPSPFPIHFLDTWYLCQFFISIVSTWPTQFNLLITDFFFKLTFNPISTLNSSILL